MNAVWTKRTFAYWCWVLRVFSDRYKNTRYGDGTSFFWSDPIFITRLSTTWGITKKRKYRLKAELTVINITLTSTSSSLQLFRPTSRHLLNYIWWLSNERHGAESVFRIHQVLTRSRNSPHFVEPEGSLPFSEPAMLPYTETGESSPSVSILFFKGLI